jgi:hypothetical protein
VLDTIVRPYAHLLDGQMLPQDAAMLRRLLLLVNAKQEGADHE